MAEFSTRIQKFTEKGEGYQEFLKLAAQPLLFSTDLLYLLWFNFKAHQLNQLTQQAPYWVVSDLMLSGLCQPVGIDVFRMEEEIRNELLPQIASDMQREIALFVQEYAQQYKSQLSTNIYEIHSIWVKGILQPQEMEKQIIEKLQNAQSEHQKVNYLSLYFNALPSKTQGTEATHITLEVAEDENDAQILRAVLPSSLRKQVKGLESYQASQEERRKKRIKEILEENIKSKNPILDLSGLGIENIEKELAPIFEYTHIAKLYLRDNNITYFPINFLEKLSNLKELYFYGNSIKNLPNEVFDFEGDCLEDVKNYFKALKHIEKTYKSNSRELDLRGLKLKVLPDALYELKKLRHLFLTNNMLVTINPKIKELEQLRVLGIEDNQLEYLPEELSGLLSLKFLDISGNRLTTLPKSFLKLNLQPNKNRKWDNKGLRLSRNNFGIDDDWLENNEPTEIIKRILKNELQEKVSSENHVLNLSNQGISDIQEEVPELLEATHVEVLHLENNQITHFPEDLLEKLPNLKELYLYGNPIENLPKEVFDFDGNCLEEVENHLNKTLKPEIIHQIEQEYNLKMKFISDIPSIIRENDNSFCVDDNNSIIGLRLRNWDIDISLVTDLMDLVFLDLKNGYLKTKEASTFTHLFNKLHKLEILNFAGFYIEDLGIISHLKNLRVLDLSVNFIQKIDFALGLVNLKVLHLEINQINYFPQDLIDRLLNLEELYLYGNPIENLPKEVFDFKGNCLEKVKGYFEELQKVQRQFTQQHKFAPEPETPKTNYTETINGVSFEMIWVEGGEFLFQDEIKITLDSFYMAKYPVTQELYEAVMGINPSDFKKSPQNPVETVSWYDIIDDFLPQLEKLTSKKHKLPTEAQWEYAVKGAQKSKSYKFAGSDDINEVAWYKENSNGKTHPVGQKKPNELGLYDMSGNVWEWCEDDWHKSYDEIPIDGSPWIEKPRVSSRVLRGGSWGRRVGYCSTVYRNYAMPANRYSGIGFRLVSLQTIDNFAHSLNQENGNKFFMA